MKLPGGYPTDSESLVSVILRDCKQNGNDDNGGCTDKAKDGFTYLSFTLLGSLSGM